MDCYAIRGNIPLRGEVDIAGAKNAALPILAASIMTNDPVVIENVPDVSDIRAVLRALETAGAKVEQIDRHTFRIVGASVQDAPMDNDEIGRIRGSYYFIGALLGKHKRAEVILPGGCKIGPRPIDQHIKGFRSLGATVRTADGMIYASARELYGSHIYMDVVSVGATINVMMAAAMARGNTVIENAAKEPHVVDLANFLNSMGAQIKGAGTDVIRIRGVDRLHGTEYSIIPDQIEAGTYMYAAAITKGDVTIRNVIPKHLESLTLKLSEIGCRVISEGDAVRVIADRRLSNTHVKTLPYPGFPTDMQPLIAVLLGISSGTSIVTESIFESRFKYVDELARMGAQIKVEGNTAIIEGIEKYTGATVTAPDLRAGAALVLAAMSAEGYSYITDIHYIERGYEDFPEKLRSLGGDVVRGDLKALKSRGEMHLVG